MRLYKIVSESQCNDFFHKGFYRTLFTESNKKVLKSYLRIIVQTELLIFGKSAINKLKKWNEVDEADMMSAAVRQKLIYSNLLRFIVTEVK